MQLKAGHTVFVRYASRVFFSDLATEAIKVEDLKWVNVGLLHLSPQVIKRVCIQGHCRLSLTRCV
jgi:hypothetical protein